MVGERSECCSCSVWFCLLDTMMVQYKMITEVRKKKSGFWRGNSSISMYKSRKALPKWLSSFNHRPKLRSICFILFSNTHSRYSFNKMTLATVTCGIIRTFSNPLYPMSFHPSYCILFHLCQSYIMFSKYLLWVLLCISMLVFASAVSTISCSLP